MTDQNDIEYFASRVLASRKAAERTFDLGAKAAHLFLAARYEELANNAQARTALAQPAGTLPL
jgi:hypothetical protein